MIPSNTLVNLKSRFEQNAGVRAPRYRRLTCLLFLGEALPACLNSGTVYSGGIWISFTSDGMRDVGRGADIDNQSTRSDYLVRVDQALTAHSALNV